MPEQNASEVCVHCKRRIYYGVVVKDAWTHAYGGTYCLTWNGFTATPLQVATPTYHGAEDVL